MYEKLCTEFYDTDKPLASAEELELYRQLFSKEDLILEPMCGSGRLLIPLRKLGYEIHGFDSSAWMLESCKKRAKDLNLGINVSQETLENYSSEVKYHGIIIPLGSFQLLHPREKAYQSLEKFNSFLAPGGKLIMDLFVPWEALYEHGETDISNRKVTLSTGEIIEIYNHTTANKFEQHMQSQLHYIKSLNDKIISEEKEQMDVLWYYPFEMELILEKYGYNNIQRINRFLNGSDHMTFVATVGK